MTHEKYYTKNVKKSHIENFSNRDLNQPGLLETVHRFVNPTDKYLVIWSSPVDRRKAQERHLVALESTLDTSRQKVFFLVKLS